MAIYHLTAKAYSRRDGHSATAGAAYRAGVRIEDARTGEVHDYTRRSGVAFAALCLPGDATADRAEFWNRVEAHHKRGDAITCREVEVALPAELDADARRELAHAFAKHLSDTYGVAADLAIHEPSKGGDERNHHAHILLSACSVNVDGTLGKKAEALDPIACKKAQRPTLADTEREHWARMVNTALATAGATARVDHRRLDAQQADAAQRGDFATAAQLDRRATQHEGKDLTAARRRGHTPKRVRNNDRVKAAAARRFDRHTRRFEELKAKAAKDGTLVQVDEQALHARALLERRKEGVQRLRAEAVGEVQAIDQAAQRKAAIRARAKRPASHKAGTSVSRQAAPAAGLQGKAAAAVERASRKNTASRQGETMAAEQIAKDLNEMIEQMLKRARLALQQQDATPLQRASARALIERHDDLVQKRRDHTAAKEGRKLAGLDRRRAEADANVRPQPDDLRNRVLRAIGRPTTQSLAAQMAQEQKQKAQAAEKQARQRRDKTREARNDAGVAFDVVQVEFLKQFPELLSSIKPASSFDPKHEPVPTLPGQKQGFPKPSRVSSIRRTSLRP
ncbi:MobA/MobL family protein [Stenotrophomonas maltophilia]|uniref:MobA/MobL family protein n=1 Tax=Stenotrophomonas maltophilia TaxID=40324 RepID=UPI003019C5D0